MGCFTAYRAAGMAQETLTSPSGMEAQSSMMKLMVHIVASGTLVTSCSGPVIALGAWPLQQPFYDFVHCGAAGKMKGIAFIKDPDGYWIEVLAPTSCVQFVDWPGNKPASA